MSDVERVLGQLGLGSDARTWLAALDAVGPAGVDLPGADRLHRLLVKLGVPEPDLQPVVSAAPTPATDPELWWLLQRSVRLVALHLGGKGEMQPSFADLPWDLGPVARYFYVYVYVASLPSTLRHHRERGIPDDVSWATLADLGDKMAMHRRAYGVGGLNKQNWLTLHLRGGIVTLGRLQFALTDAAEYGGGPHGTPYEQVLGVHIPGGGPLSPAACTTAFQQAPSFFAQHFPEHTASIALCSSWLLDEQLAAYLPAESNILRFQERFTLLSDTRDGDEDVLEFVAGRANFPWAELPRRTALEKGIAEHLANGRHFTVRTGWCPLVSTDC